MYLLAAISLTNLTNQGEWRTIEAIERAMEAAMASTQVNLYEAKTHLSSLVDRAAKGEEIVIAKAGKPMAKLVKSDKETAPARIGKKIFQSNFLTMKRKKKSITTDRACT
jgi:prevent-host-death family protein